MRELIPTPIANRPRPPPAPLSLSSLSDGLIYNSLVRHPALSPPPLLVRSATVKNLCKATKTGGSSGTYSVRGFGSELDFADCSSAYATTHPCALGSTSYSFELSISGAGASCSGLPTLDPNVLASSVSACADKFDGYICSAAACTSADFTKSGSLSCDNGNWVNTLTCVNLNASPPPPAPPPRRGV